MKKIMVAIVSVFMIASLQAGLAKTDIFIKNLMKTSLTDSNTHKAVAPQVRECVSTISRRGLLGKDADQEYKGVFALDKNITLLLVVHFSEAKGLRVMVRDENKTETESDWILIPAGNGSYIFGIAPDLVVRVFYYQQALLPDIEFEIANIAI